MITACIVLLYLSYAIPVICLLIRGRSNIKPGPFWLGPVGLVANIVLLVWTLFTLAMYSFPYAKPVAASNMNCTFCPKIVIRLTTRLRLGHLLMFDRCVCCVRDCGVHNWYGLGVQRQKEFPRRRGAKSRCAGS